MSENILVKQNEMIIYLLARQINLGKGEIKKIITRGKRNPRDYIRGYNACNGKNGVTEIARIIGVKQPTLTPILKNWEEEGIIFNVGEERKPMYMKLMKIGD